MSDHAMEDALDTFLQAVQHQRTVTSDSLITDELSREGTVETLLTPPRGPRAPTVETPDSPSRDDAAVMREVRPDAASPNTASSATDSDEDLDTTRSEFVATRMFFRQTHTQGDLSPIAKAPAPGESDDADDDEEGEPLARMPTSMDDVEAIDDNASPLIRRPTSIAAAIKGNHTPSKMQDTPDITDGNSSLFDRSTRPPRDDSEYFFIDNHDGTGYLTNATRQDDGNYLLGQTVLLAQSQATLFGGAASQSGTLRRAGAASPVVVPPSENASPLPHQVRLRDDAAGEASANFDLGATQNLMMNHSFADSTVSGAMDFNASFGSIASPSISRVIARARNDQACGAAPQRVAPDAMMTTGTRSAAPERAVASSSAAKHLAFDASFVLDSSFMMDQTLLGQSLRTDLGRGPSSVCTSGVQSPAWGSPLPRRQRGAVAANSLGASFSMGGAASPIPDAPVEEPYLVREARAEREAGVDRVYVQPPAQDVTPDALTAQGWQPVFVDFRRRATDYEVSPTSQSPIPNDPLHDRAAIARDDQDAFADEDDVREASLSRIDTMNSSFASSTCLDQTVLNNISRRLNMSMSSAYPGSLAGSPRIGGGAALTATSIPPSTPLGQIMRRQSSSSVWSVQSPLPTAPDTATPFEREGSPSRAGLGGASVSIGQRTTITDLLTSMSMPQRATVGSSDWYGTSNTAFLSNTDGSTTATALSYSGQASMMMMGAQENAKHAARRTSSATVTSNSTALSAYGASVGIGGRSTQSVGLGNSSFRVTHCKRASMGPTMLKAAIPLSRGHLSASTSTARVHVDSAVPTTTTTHGTAVAHTHAQHPPTGHGHHAINRGHQLDCAGAPVRRTTRERPDLSVFVPWSPLTITPENSMNLGAGWNAAAGNGSMLDGGASPCSPPRAGQSTATVPGYSPDKVLRETTAPVTEMKWIPFTASLTTNTTTTEDDTGADMSSCGRPSLSLAASGISPTALQALRDGILAAVQQQHQQQTMPHPPHEASPFSCEDAEESIAARSRALERDETVAGIGAAASARATMSNAVETLPASLLDATTLDRFSHMDSAATSVMMQSITLFAMNELLSQSQSRAQAAAESGEETEPEPRLSTAVVASIAQRWIAEQQRAGKENCHDPGFRGASVGSKRSTKSASASPARQPSLSARAPSEVNANRMSSSSS